MKNPLNDIRLFCAICAGAGFAFGVSALLTLGCISGISSQFAKLSVVALIFAGVCFAADKLCEHIEKTDEKGNENE